MRTEFDVALAIFAGQPCSVMLVAWGLCCADRALLAEWVETVCGCRLGSRKGNSTTFIDMSAPRPDMPATAAGVSMIIMSSDLHPHRSCVMLFMLRLCVEPFLWSWFHAYAIHQLHFGQHL